MTYILMVISKHVQIVLSSFDQKHDEELRFSRLERGDKDASDHIY